VVPSIIIFVVDMVVPVCVVIGVVSLDVVVISLDDNVVVMSNPCVVS